MRVMPGAALLQQHLAKAHAHHAHPPPVMLQRYVVMVTAPRARLPTATLGLWLLEAGPGQYPVLVQGPLSYWQMRASQRG